MSSLSTARKLYFAYGSNANSLNMMHRCPRAIPVGIAQVKGYEMVFRGVANLRKKKKSKSYGVVWSITRKCEKTLDWHEEYPRVYVKVYVLNKKYGNLMMFYTLKAPLLKKYPADNYNRCIAAGYKEFNIPEQQLDRALEKSEGKTLQYTASNYDYKI